MKKAFCLALAGQKAFLFAGIIILQGLFRGRNLF